MNAAVAPSVRKTLFEAAVVVLALWVCGCRGPGGGAGTLRFPTPVAQQQAHGKARKVEVPRDTVLAQARFAAGVALDVEAQRLEGFFTYQRVSRGVRQPSLLRDARAYRQKALEALGEALACDPGSPAILRRKGDVLLQIGRVDEALELYWRADAKSVANPRWYFRIATQLKHLTRLDDAAGFLEKVAANPSYASNEFLYIAWLELGDLYTRMERFGEAERVYRAALLAKRLNVKLATTAVGATLAERLKEDPTGIRRLLILSLTKQNKLDEALLEARKASRQAPSDARALAALADVYNARDEKDQAVEAARDFVKRSPSNQVGVLTLMRSLASVGKVTEAIDAANAYMSEHPDETRVAQEVVRIYREAGLSEEAVEFVLGDEKNEFPVYSVAMSLLNMFVKSGEAGKAFELAGRILVENPLAANVPVQVLGLLWSGLPPEDCEAFARRHIDEHPDDLRLDYSLARILAAKGQAEKAGDLFVSAAEKGASSGYAYENAARRLTRKGEFVRGVTLFLAGVDKGFVARPEDAVQGLIDESGDAAADAAELEGLIDDYDSALTTLYEIIGGLYIDADENVKAEEYYRRALEAPMPRLFDYAGLAISLYRQDKSSEAIKLVEDLKSKGQGVPPLMRMLVAMLSSDGAYDHEREIAERLVGELPTDIDNRMSLVGVYVDEEDYASAEEELLVALNLAEGDDNALSRVRYTLGIVYDEQGKDDLAVSMWRANLDLDPDDANSNNALAYHLAERGTNLEEARRLVEKALQSEPDNGAYLDTLGWIYYKMGKIDLAVENLRKAAGKEKDAVIFDHLGDALLEAGDAAGALEAWREGLSAKPKQKDRLKIEHKIENHAADGGPKEAKQGG